ncbi:MAG: MFS transporter [Pseudomonadota bacterium]
MATAAPTSAGSLDRIIDDGRVTGQQLLVVGLCMLFNMLDGFDITAMAVVASDVARDLELPSDQIGLILSAPLFGMMIGAMTVAPLSDLFGRRKLIIVSVSLVGASVLLTTQATTLAEFLALRVISGLGAGAMLATQATLAAEYSPDKFRSLSVAAVTAGYPLGAMFTSVVAQEIVPSFGWPGVFWFGGGLTLAMGLVALLWLPESLKYLVERQPPNALARVNAILRRLDREAITALPPKPPTLAEQGLVVALRTLLAPAFVRVTLTMWLVFFLCFATLYFLMSWIPKLMIDSGFARDVAGQAFFLFNLGGVIGIFTMGLLATRIMLTNIISVLKLLGAAGMIAFALAPSSEFILLAVIFLVGVTMQGGFTGMYSAAAKAYPTAIRSTGIGWCIGLGRSGAVISPYVAGLLIAGGFDMAENFIFFAVPLAIGGLIAFTLRIR